MNTRLAATWITLLGSVIAAIGQPVRSSDALAAYETNKVTAEKFYAEGSFARANEIYRQVDVTNLPAAEAHWVAFRAADTQWRSQAATQTADTTKLDQARQQLEVLIRDARADEHDVIWVEVEESLGDFYWTRRGQQNWGAAWGYYQAALDWWAGAHDLELARERYLKIVWRAVRPPGSQREFYYGYWGNYIPLEVLDNALKIAQTDNDKAFAHYLVAMTLRNQGGQWDQRARVPDEFEAAIKIGKSTDWYDDALYNYAEWMTGQGRIIPLENGTWRSEPDYVKALELFRRLVREFDKGETRYYESAQQQIRNITDPQLSVSVPNVFLPDSEIQYYLNWRNVKHIDLALFPVDLNREVKLDEQHPVWLDSINTGPLEKIKSWSRETGDRGNYQPTNETLRLEGKLKPGAYVLEVRAEGKKARELVLVTDASLVLKTSGRQALVYACNALDGSPLARSHIKLWEGWQENNTWHFREYSKDAGADGLAVFDLQADRRQTGTQLFASAVQEDRQAFSFGNNYWYNPNIEPWRIYAYTDRPAYRPKETVNWKFIARRYNGSVYSTPSDERIEYEITDPRGAKVKADKATLNTFGSVWGSLEVTDQLPLGEYRVQFWDEGRHRGIGGAVLFRLEEYKLPEFKVTVQTPEENGAKKAFRLGEKIEASIQTDYYFGGPVANANVEVVVYQNPFWHYWHEPRAYSWYYEDLDSSPYYWQRRAYGGGQIIKRETLKTDATGKATITFESPANAGQDFDYRIEARVTDSSRREITGSGNVRVTRQRYYVYPQPDHNLYRPQDKVAVNFKALDANEQPVQTDGIVKVTREYWFEIWLAPDGYEVKGDELKRLQSSSKIWPPPPARPDQKGWRLKFRGYEHDDVLTRTLKTDTNGMAALNFTPEREGYYRIAWTSEDASRSTNQVARPPAPPITAGTTVWVANNATTDLGYRHGGVEIIVDKDTFRAGNKAPVMLVAPTADRYVLFSVEGEDLYSYQLVHLDGTVKLIELPIEEKHVPNIFLSATLVSDRQIFIDTKQIVVPPTKNFLTVDVKPDRVQYQPRDEGTLLITTRNDEGKPVSAEISLGLVDESVFYIQSDYAGDPRQFYFGSKRSQRVQTVSTFQQKSYAKFVTGENEQLLDELEQEKRLANEEFDANGRSDYFLADAVTKSSPRREMMMEQESLANGPSGGGGFGGGARNRTTLARSAAAAGTMTAADLAVEAPAPMVGQPSGEEPAVVVRSDFRSTVIWQPDLITDRDGKATVKVKYPDSTTSWKATARAATAGNQFGICDQTTRTKQPLIVRLQAPRFFVVGDFVVVSAVVNNNTDQPLTVQPKLDAAGLDVTGLFENGQPLKGEPGPLTVPANGEARQDWYAHVSRPGEVKLKVSGRGGKYSDAMEKSYTAYEHGIEKFISKSGKARGNDLTVKLDLPTERKPGSALLTVQVTPSMAVTMLDALPYLIDYPYGCTEQTMSRFLPAAITAKTLRDLGLKPEDVMGRVFGGIETNFAAATHPRGSKDLKQLDQMVNAGLERLYDFQHSDGGWGWWKQGDSDHWMTAYVVWGLALARDAGVPVKEDVARRAAKYLDEHLVEEEENPDMQAFMLHALSAHYVPYQGKLGDVDFIRFVPKAEDNLWKRREALNAYTRALFALAEHNLQHHDRAKTLVENLENGVKRDDRPDTSVLTGPDPSHLTPDTSVQGTAHWGEDGIYWRWSDGGVEATAFALRALLAIDPQNKLIEPITNWLIKNRRGAQWNSTRDTAIVVLTLNDYLRTSGELKAEAEYELIVNGTPIAKKKVAGADIFDAPSRFAIDPKLIKDHNEIRIRQAGSGGARPLYFAAEAKFFSLEEPIAPAGSEIFVKREYYKLVGRPTLLKGYVYDKEPLRDGESVTSGERVETLLTIETKNNYEYLMFEDLKPAGLEAVEVRSGESVYARELKSGAVDRKFVAAPAAVQKTEYIVQSGETLSGIARANRITVSAIRSANNLRSDRIQAGQKLILPPSVRSPANEDYTGRQRWVYQELRDRKVALFLDKLPEGVWEIRYDLRAEVPGEFHALPVTGQAMYVPEIRCNGAEVRINVTEAAKE